MAQNRVQAIVRTSLAGSSLTSSYQAINTGLDGACFRIALINTTNGAIDVSFDGTNTHEVIPANTRIDIESQTNGQPDSWVALFAKGLVVYVKGSSGAGNVYLCGYYVLPRNQ